MPLFGDRRGTKKLHDRLETLCRQDWECQDERPFNERPVEYAFVFSQIARWYPEHVLDVGTGDSSLPHLMSFCGCNVSAIDNVRDFWPAGMLNRHFLVEDDDITKPHTKRSFDLITCISVLEHIEDFDAAMRGLFGLLSPGGHLVMSFPYSEKRFVDNVYKLPESDAAGRDVPYICRSYSRRELDHWLKESGAEIVEQAFFRFWEGECWSEGKQIVPPTPAGPDDSHQLTLLSMRRIG